MSNLVQAINNLQYFHRLSIGQKFQTHVGGEVFTKTRKGGTEMPYSGAPYNINSQKLVILVEDVEENLPLEDLDFHTFDFTAAQLAEVIKQIVQRVADDYPTKNIDGDRLRKGLYAAHRAKPIRLIALLHACALDFPKDVIMGVYRHYDPRTDSIRGGWTAQHAEPHRDFWAELIAVLSGDDDED